MKEAGKCIAVQFSLCLDKSGLCNLFVFGNKKGVELLIGGVGLHLRNKEHCLLECKCTAPCKILFRVLYIQMPVFLHLGQSVIKPVSDVRGREFDQA